MKSLKKQLGIFLVFTFILTSIFAVLPATSVRAEAPPVEVGIASEHPVLDYGFIFYLDGAFTNSPYENVSVMPEYASAIFVNGKTVQELNNEGWGLGIELYGPTGDLGNAIKINNGRLQRDETYTVEVREPLAGPSGNILKPFMRKWVSGAWQADERERLKATDFAVAGETVVVTFSGTLAEADTDAKTVESLAAGLCVNGTVLAEAAEVNAALSGDKLSLSSTAPDGLFAGGQFTIELREDVDFGADKVISAFAKLWKRGAWSNLGQQRRYSVQDFAASGEAVIVTFDGAMTDAALDALTLESFAANFYINKINIAELAGIGAVIEGNLLTLTAPAGSDVLFKDGKCLLELKAAAALPDNDQISSFAKYYDGNAWGKPPQNVSETMAKAHIRVEDGVPQLYVDDVLTAPYFNFVNGDMMGGGEGYLETMRSTIRHAADNGIDLVQVHCNHSSLKPKSDGSYSFADVDKVMSLVLGANPNAKVMLRMYVGDSWSSELGYPLDEHQLVFADGSKDNQISIASDMWYEAAQAYVRETVRYVRSRDDYANSVIAYMMNAGEAGEWFQVNIRTGGLDYSPVNSRKFGEWAKAKYGDIASLNTAWQVDYTTFDQVEVPRDMAGSGAWIVGVGEGTLLDPETEQRLIDYGDYYSEMTAGRVEGLCKIIKEESGGDSLAVAFYGYDLAMFDARSGHSAGELLKASPYVDMMAAPINYNNRNEGEHGASQGLRDSVMLCGKLWMDEADYRAPISTNPDTTNNNDWPYYAPTKELFLEVVERQMATNLLTGSGTWLMDLSGKGWYDDADIWRIVGRYAEEYQNRRRTAKTAEVAYIVDEGAYALYNNAGAFNWTAVAVSTNTVNISGLDFGMYTMRDAIEGRLPDTRLYIFLNPVRISDADAVKLAEQLHQPGKTAAWMYGFGQTSPESVRLLTGMDIATEFSKNQSLVELLPGVQDEIGSPLAVLGNIDDAEAYMGDGKLAFKNNDHFSYLNSTEGVTVKGVNPENGKPNFGILEKDGHTTIFCAAAMIKPAELVRYFAKVAGANVYIDTNEYLIASDNTIVLHTKTAGPHTIRLPFRTNVKDLKTGQLYPNTSSLTVDTFQYETKVFLYGADVEGTLGAVPEAVVKKQQGNKNSLTITVTESFVDGSTHLITETFSIANNAAGTYTVGAYQVYVNTKGNTQIRECRIVE